MRKIILLILSICIAVVVVLSSWLFLSIRQVGLYDRENYNCKHMSIDLERFFESIGIDTSIASGHRYDETGTLRAHTWLILNFPFGSLEFDSMTLTFRDISSRYYVSSVK